MKIKKNFFYALTLYHILCVTAYIIKKNRKNNVIAISDVTVDRERLVEALRQSQLFDDVIVIRDRAILDLDVRKENYTTEELDEIISHKAECVEKALPFNIAEFDNIYVCADHFPLGIYLNYKKIPYFYFEDGAGQQSFCEKTVEASIKPCDIQLWYIVNYLQLFGRNSNVLRRFINKECQVNKNYKKDRIKSANFNVVNILKRLSKQKKKIIFEIFEIKQLELNDRSAVIFPVNNVANGIIAPKEQLIQSTLLADYFGKGYDVSIKPHPNDSVTQYTQIKKWHILENCFPAELLALYTKRKIGRIITTWSTTGNSLRKLVNENVCVGELVDRQIWSINSYYVALMYLNFLKVSIRDVDYSNTNDLLMNSLIVYGNISNSSIQGRKISSKICVIDTACCEIHNSNLKNEMIIIDSMHVGETVLKSRNYHTIQVKQDLGEYTKKDYIYIVGESLVKEFTFQKELEYSKLQLSVELKNDY